MYVAAGVPGIVRSDPVLAPKHILLFGASEFELDFRDILKALFCLWLLES